MADGIVTFNQVEWVALYPELAIVTNAQRFFDLASIQLNNTPLGAISDLARRKSLLYLLTAHIAKLFAPGLAIGGVVGRVSSASQGSVSVSTELTLSQSAAWYAQTPYGLLYWQLTKGYRSARWIPGVQPLFDRRYFADPYRVP